jgi:O-antigen/teichoic acid export membrane protein
VNIKSFKNASLRFANVFLKGVFSLLVIKILSLEDVGQWSIINSEITFCYFLLGWEIWYYYNRNLTEAYQKKFKRKQLSILTNQFVSYIIIYSLIIPLIGIYLSVKYPNEWFLILIIIAIFQISNEISRVLIHIDEHTLSGIVVISVQSVWPIVVLLLWALNFKLNIVLILIVNCLISLVGLIYTLTIYNRIFQLNIKTIKLGFKLIEIKYIFRIFKVSTLILFNTQLGNLSIISGRLILENFSLAYVAIFSYYQYLSSLGLIFIDYLISRVYINKLLMPGEFTKKNINEFRKKVVVSSVIIFLLSVSFAYPIFQFFIKVDSLLTYYYLFILINFSYFLSNIAYFYTSLLYVKMKDKVLLLANFISVLPYVSVLCLVLIFQDHSLMIVSISLFVYMLFTLLIKRYFVKKMVYSCMEDVQKLVEI